MRIISGRARGLKLKTLEGSNTRPTTDRIKESLFNIISGRICDSKILDVFSGSGALSMEAISRGASYAVLIDNNRKAIDVIKYNLEKAKMSEDVKLYYGDALDILNRLDDKYDIIFVDPPYFEGLYFKVISVIMKNNLLSSDGIIIVERDTKCFFNFELSGLSLFDSRSYGRTTIDFYKIL